MNFNHFIKPEFKRNRLNYRAKYRVMVLESFYFDCDLSKPAD